MTQRFGQQVQVSSNYIAGHRVAPDKALAEGCAAIARSARPTTATRCQCTAPRPVSKDVQPQACQSWLNWPAPGRSPPCGSVRLRRHFGHVAKMSRVRLRNTRAARMAPPITCVRLNSALMPTSGFAMSVLVAIAPLAPPYMAVAIVGAWHSSMPGSRRRRAVALATRGTSVMPGRWGCSPAASVPLGHVSGNASPASALALRSTPNTL